MKGRSFGLTSMSNAAVYAIGVRYGRLHRYHGGQPHKHITSWSAACVDADSEAYLSLSQQRCLSQYMRYSWRAKRVNFIVNIHWQLQTIKARQNGQSFDINPLLLPSARWSLHPTRRPTSHFVSSIIFPHICNYGDSRTRQSPGPPSRAPR